MHGTDTTGRVVPTLADAGYAATVYEAGDRVGGRMCADAVTGWEGPHVAEPVDPAHTALLDLAARFQIVATGCPADEPDGPLDTFRSLGAYYPRGLALADFAPVRAALDVDIAAAPFPTLYDSFTPAGYDLDHMSVHEWIETRVPGGLRSPLGALLDVAYEIELGAPTSDQSALNVVHQLGRELVAPCQASAERYHISGGGEQLPRSIAAALPADSIRYRSELIAVARRRDAGYRLSFGHPDGAFSADVDRVVLAIPFSALRDVDISRAGFDPVKVTGIQQLGYGGGAAIGPGCRQALAARAQDLLERLEPVFPRITDLWNDRPRLPLLAPLLSGSYSYWRVGQCTRFGGSEGRRSGRCHFAGEHCSLAFRGSTEGAVREGARAANEILSDYRHGVFP
jgi:monoamine oxidase